MSIIRQRRKNLLVSGLLGFMLAVLILTVLGFVFRQTIADKLDISPRVEVEEAVLLPTIVAARPIEKGTILDSDDVVTIMVDERVKVVDHFSQVSQLVGKKTAVNIDANMPMTGALFVDDALIQKDLRLYEVSFVELPYTLSLGDMIDIRIAFPTGQEYVVLSKKEVKGFERRATNVHQGLLNLALEEEEALRMSSALVDSYLADGARVYMVKYIDPDQQAAAWVNYPVNEHVLQLLQENPNILETSDIGPILQARGLLNAALTGLVDDEDQMVVRVDMTTPEMTSGNMTPEAEAAQEAPVAEPQTSPPATTSTSTSGTSDAKAGIGF